MIWTLNRTVRVFGREGAECTRWSYCEFFFGFLLLVKRLAEGTSFLLDTSQGRSNLLSSPVWCQVPAGITFVSFGGPGEGGSIDG